MKTAPVSSMLVAVVVVLSGAALLSAVRKPHVLEFAHYYTGAKYAPETGYDGLYVALAAALAEIYGEERFAAAVPLVTRLDGRGFISSTGALKVFEGRRSSWEPDRWESFLGDVRFLDGALRRYSDEEPLRHWRTVLRDHGYNASPLYTALVWPLANRGPLSQRSLLLLCSIDAALLAVLFSVLALTFGLRGASFSFIFLFSSLDMLSYVTWALLRFDWLLAMALGVLFLSRGRRFLSGFFWGIAALLRVFPGVIALFFLLTWILKGRRKSAADGKWVSFAAGGFNGLLFSSAVSTLILTLFAGIEPVTLWGGFARRIGLHAGAGGRLNGVGIGKIFEALSPPGASLLEPLLALTLAVVLAWALVRREDRPETGLALSIFCAPLFLYLSHYYYLMLVLPVAVREGRVRLAVWVLIIVNAAVWGGKIAGLDYYRLLDAECLAYSALLLAIPPALLLQTGGRGRGRAISE